MTERFDAIVVGAGPAGNAAAYTMAKAGLSVLQIERGETPGSKNVQGAILYAHALEEIIPDFREDAPLERQVVEQRIWMLDDKAHVGTHYRADTSEDERPNRYTIIRASFDRWFWGKVREAGALVVCETTVTDLIREGNKVVGVRTDRPNGDVLGDVVILAEGANPLVGNRAGLTQTPRTDQVALAVKEMHFLPPETIEARFNISGEEGVVIEAAGTVTGGMLGTGFIYTNKESLAVGIGCLVSDFAETGTTPYDLLERFKSHPSIRPLLAGSEVREYAAHLIPEGGYRAQPKLYGDGWLVAGDSGQFVNSLHREGSNLAMTTGRLAGETVIEVKRAGKPMTSSNLALYRKRLDGTHVVKDLKKYRDLPKILHRNKQFVSTYPRLVASAADTWFRVDGVDKRTKERSIMRNFLKTRSLAGLIGDAVKLARAFR